MLLPSLRVSVGGKVNGFSRAACLTAVAVGIITAQGADTLSSLQAKRIKLEQELAAINADIQKLAPTQAGANHVGDYFIKEFGTWHFDSAGGVEPYFVFSKPEKARAVKYISIKLQPYNAAGDMVSQTGNAAVKNVNFISPFEHNHAENRSWWEPVRYDSGVRCLKVSSVRITFADGKMMSYSGKALKKVFAPNVKNECLSHKAA